MNNSPEQQRIAELEQENARLKVRIKELDLYYGQQSLAMRSAVIEHAHGEGEIAAMAWLINYLSPRGELPPEGEADAQAYFDREIKPVEKGLAECYQFFEENRARKKSAAE